METSRQNLLKQKFEWDLRESFFIINGIFSPKEKAMKGPASHYTSKAYPYSEEGSWPEEDDGRGGGSITLSLYAAVHFVEGKTRYSASPLRSLSKI
jgi:hypothetical protein